MRVRIEGAGLRQFDIGKAEVTATLDLPAVPRVGDWVMVDNDWWEVWRVLWNRNRPAGAYDPADAFDGPVLLARPAGALVTS